MARTNGGNASATAKKAAPGARKKAATGTPAVPAKTAAKKVATKAVVAKKAAPAKKSTVTKSAVAGAATKPRAVKSTSKAVATKPAATKTAATKTVATKTTSARTAATKSVPAKSVATKVVPAQAAPKKAASLAVKAGEKPWTAAELKEVRAELEGDREKLREELAFAESELSELMRDAGDGAGNDTADMGSATFERDHEMSLANNQRDMLLQTEHALERIDAGTYGICESCGEPIGKARLMVFPRATLCLTCKQREERR